MTTSRFNHTASLLADGKVLIIGGEDGSEDQGVTVPASAEIFDPATQTFTASSPMSTARAFHTATVLLDGTVLITGGLVIHVRFARASECGDLRPCSGPVPLHRQHVGRPLHARRNVVAGREHTHHRRESRRHRRGAGQHRSLPANPGQCVAIRGHSRRAPNDCGAQLSHRNAAAGWQGAGRRRSTKFTAY